MYSVKIDTHTYIWTTIMHVEIPMGKFVNSHVCLQFIQITLHYPLSCIVTVAGHFSSGFIKLACYLTPLGKDRDLSTDYFTGSLNSIY